METSTGSKFLIDGFPRNKDNLTGWESEMNGRVDFRFVLFFDCPETVRYIDNACPNICDYK